MQVIISTDRQNAQQQAIEGFKKLRKMPVDASQAQVQALMTLEQFPYQEIVTELMMELWQERCAIEHQAIYIRKEKDRQCLEQ